MCIFCAAIPVAGAAGVSLNTKQMKERHSSEATGTAPESPAGRDHVDLSPRKPILPITGGVIALLMVGSLTYHTLTRLPY